MYGVVKVRLMDDGVSKGAGHSLVDLSDNHFRMGECSSYAINTGANGTISVFVRR